MSLEASMVGALTDFTQDVFMRLFVTQLTNQDPMVLRSLRWHEEGARSWHVV